MLISPKEIQATRFPSIAYIETTFSGGQRTAGTGTLIGPRLLLTAGHVVLESQRLGGRPRAIRVTLGSNPRTTIAAVDWRTTRTWIERDANLPMNRRLLSNADLGAVVLPKPIDLSVSIFGNVQTAPSDRLNSMQLNVGGYVPNAPSRILVGTTSAGGVMARVPNRLTYPVQTFGGMSGGPVWSFDPESKSRTIRGIHTSFLNGRGGNALRVTNHVLNLVNTWLEEFHPSSDD